MDPSPKAWAEISPLGVGSIMASLLATMAVMNPSLKDWGLKPRLSLWAYRPHLTKIATSAIIYHVVCHVTYLKKGGAVVSPSLSDTAYEVIKQEIITCTLEPGQQIAQHQLAARHQLGLTPIREALQRLVLEGFVQAIPRFGYIVSPITFSDVHEVFELRSILEAAAARLAALRATDQQLAEFSAAANFTYVYKDPESYSGFLSLNADFHHSLGILAGNQRLADQISKVLDELTRVFHLGLDIRNSTDEMRDEHLMLAQALRDRDPDRAGQIAQAQIARSQQRILEALTDCLIGGAVATGGLQRTVQVEPTRLS